jgi:hypothetical protein
MGAAVIGTVPFGSAKAGGAGSSGRPVPSLVQSP